MGLYVNAVVQPGGRRISLRPSRRPDQLLQMLEALAKVVCFGGWPIEMIVEMEAGNLPYGATIVVVTAVVTDRLRRTLVELPRRGYGVALVALGQARLDEALPGVQYYHIGGREVWNELGSLALA